MAERHGTGGHHPATQTRCNIQRNWRTEERIAAWDVSYKYRGQIYHTQMPDEPGKKIRVRVHAEPAPW